jgi:proteasome accessory factor C
MIDGANKSTRQSYLIKMINNMHHSYSFKELAEKFHVSEKTIDRDIEDIQCYRHAPIERKENHVYWHNKKDYIYLEGFWFGFEELSALLSMQHILEKLSNGILKRELEPFKEAIEKHLKIFEKKNTISLSHKIKFIEAFARIPKKTIFLTIAESLKTSKRLNIQFWHRDKNENSERMISPQQLVRYRDRWLLDAWCHLRNQIRTFSLEAIESAELFDEGIQVIDPELLKEHLESSYGIFAGKADKEAVLKFSPYIARWLQYEIWHPEQKGIFLSRDFYELTLPYSHDGELIQDIMRFGPEVEVISPPELRDKMIKKIGELQNVYAKDRICL